MSGPPPTPTRLKLLRGNPGKRALPKNEPIPPDGEIKCPPWLKRRAKTIFRDYQSILESMNLLTVADVHMLALLASTEAEFIECEQDIQKNGRSRKIFTDAGEKWAPNPAVAMRSDAGKRVKALMVEFGLSPSSRTRIGATPKAKEADPFAKYERQG